MTSTRRRARHAGTVRAAQRRLHALRTRRAVLNGHVVVLAAGFSVPYYIWDPTFNALTAPDSVCLRYDYYGRGYSDRPAILSPTRCTSANSIELLNAVHISDPIDLAGISFGGSLITSFADKYPDRVRSLIYFDPSIRKPYELSLSRHAAGLELPHRHPRRAVLGGRPAGDFLHPEQFPDWPAAIAIKCSTRDSVAPGFRRSSATLG